uniref:EF-hand domain-containing protein n=1 Tax=Calcidiscus leptoporus TaxID=127549 RepID=A0A7S0P2U6_9EUKA|mmetsp:Transcript_4845/g.11032  ORF Transcript_4845/g.11032 Transcript_4845/m.11032 type:complete len:382 (+) Transcript_4845:33-1178(+)
MGARMLRPLLHLAALAPAAGYEARAVRAWRSRARSRTAMAQPGELPRGPYLDRGLARQLVFNQLAVGYTIWTGGVGAEILEKQVHLDSPAPWLVGTLAALPVLALGRAVETSDSPLFTTLNLSTDAIVERLLGEVKQPVFALLVSVLLALLTGVCEEIIFRGGVLPALASYAVTEGFADTLAAGVPFGVAASSVLFSLGHLPFLGLARGEVRAFFSADTLVLFALQLATGGSFALTFVFTGSLTAAIVAHFLYDFYTLYATHLAVTDQIAYSKSPLPPLPQQSLAAMRWRMAKGGRYVDGARRVFLRMDTNRDDAISRGELRQGLAMMGLRLSSKTLEQSFAMADLDTSGDIDFEEFLDFVGSADTEASRTIKASLLGVRA